MKVRVVVRGQGYNDWRQGVGKVSTAVSDFLFPPRCPLTGEFVQRQGTLSPAAWSRLSHLSAPWCDLCGQPFERPDMGPLCVPCTSDGRLEEALIGPRRLDRFRAAVAYDDHIAGAILGLKYGDRHDGVSSFAGLLAAAGADLLARPDTLLVPIPLHPRRLLQRRYNQAGTLAAALGRRTGLPVDHLSLVRKRRTVSQRGQSAAMRRRNVAGAFAVTEPAAIADRHVVLIDDVLTTGATMVAAARTLKRGGAAGVTGLTIARVIRARTDEAHEFDENEGTIAL